MSCFLLVCFLLLQLFLARSMASRCYELKQEIPPKSPPRSDLGQLQAARRLTGADPPSGAGAESSPAAEAPSDEPPPEDRALHKSVIAGWFVIGGLVIAVFATIYIYIRVTRDADKH